MTLTSILQSRRSWWCTALLVVPMAHALAAPDREAIQAQYNSERERCVAMQADPEARAVCLKEAGAARQAALSGALAGAASPTERQRNALARCEVHKDVVDRASCERLVLGEGASQGSVEGGGVIRALKTPIDPK